VLHISSDTPLRRQTVFRLTVVSTPHILIQSHMEHERVRRRPAELQPPQHVERGRAQGLPNSPRPHSRSPSASRTPSLSPPYVDTPAPPSRDRYGYRLSPGYPPSTTGLQSNHIRARHPPVQTIRLANKRNRSPSPSLVELGKKLKEDLRSCFRPTKVDSPESPVYPPEKYDRLEGLHWTEM